MGQINTNNKTGAEQVTDLYGPQRTQAATDAKGRVSEVEATTTPGETFVQGRLTTGETNKVALQAAAKSPYTRDEMEQLVSNTMSSLFVNPNRSERLRLLEALKRSLEAHPSSDPSVKDTLLDMEVIANFTLEEVRALYKQTKDKDRNAGTFNSLIATQQNKNLLLAVRLAATRSEFAPVHNVWGRLLVGSTPIAYAILDLLFNPHAGILVPGALVVGGTAYIAKSRKNYLGKVVFDKKVEEFDRNEHDPFVRDCRAAIASILKADPRLCDALAEQYGLATKPSETLVRSSDVTTVPREQVQLLVAATGIEEDDTLREELLRQSDDPNNV